jgi:hypothetical protein
MWICLIRRISFSTPEADRRRLRILIYTSPPHHVEPFCYIKLSLNVKPQQLSFGYMLIPAAELHSIR